MNKSVGQKEARKKEARNASSPLRDQNQSRISGSTIPPRCFDQTTIFSHTQHESWNQFFQFFIYLIWMVIVDPLKEERVKKL